MNCWIILFLLSCCGKNNGVMQTDMGCGYDCHAHHNHCDNSCIQPRMYEKDCNVRCDRDCDDYDHNHAHTHNDGCGCTGEDRVREKWMPYTECNDNDRRDCGCK